MSLPNDSLKPTGNVDRKPSVTFQEQNRPSRPTSNEDLRENKGQHFGFSRHHSSDNLSQDVESGRSGMARKKSLVRPERERIDPNHRQWYYRNHAAQMDQNRNSNVVYMPSSTGFLPQHGALPSGSGMAGFMGPGGGVSGYGVTGSKAPPPMNFHRGTSLRRGKSILGQNDDKVESGIHFLRRGVSMRRVPPGNPDLANDNNDKQAETKAGTFDWIAPGPVGPWMIFCWFITCCITSPCLSMVGIKTPEQQRAWREKMGLMVIILCLMALVGYITFGFTQTVCGIQNRYLLDEVFKNKTHSSSALVGGKTLSLDDWTHKPFPGDDNPKYINLTTNPIAYTYLYGADHGANLNLLFQKTGDACEGILEPVPNQNPPRYFKCAILRRRFPSGSRIFEDPGACHTVETRSKILSNSTDIPVHGTAFVSWDQLKDYDNYLFYRSAVIDLNILEYSDTKLTPFMQELKNNDTKKEWTKMDVTAKAMRRGLTKELDCLKQLGSIASLDVDSYGCIASKVELVVSMIVIVGVVGIKFLFAVFFAWCLSWRIGNYDKESYAQRMKRMNDMEDWSEDIYRPAPAGYRPNVKKPFLPTTSRFNQAYQKPQARPTTMERKIAAARMGTNSVVGSPPHSPMLATARSSTSITQPMLPSSQSIHSSNSGSDSPWGPCPFPLWNVVPQPPASYQPFNFPLVHTICLVTAYSESIEGLRTTLDSLSTTNYPNSHKLLLVIADGIVKGADSDVSTPDICLSMMKDLVVPPEEVEGYSYVAIADGSKRHNMAKVYAGFYDYDDQTVERSKQQRVPMILIAKCGSMLELDSAKPGNRGKRDSQVVLMAFMQKVLFDERMTQFEYEFFNAIWRVTGITPENYEIVLMVDADTKVFPDSLTRMVASMVQDPEIMGLCGETKIANKAQTWVTMIQVFEYYISHHQTKGFESCFGVVTCLPGCFSAYRIKAPKGPKGFYVPILANPDIVEHYSENVVDTLHKKNLLLLGEDRYLTTLMLKTFPKRKLMFVPSAVCKTVVPDAFRVLRSQRRRWINSTIHNLFELIQVNGLCGTFCFSMRFVVFMDTVGTLVLPAAIAFTVYVVITAILTPIQNQGKDPGQKKEFPTLPLVLLALILGLPGVLIVVTSRRFMYVIWMLIYLISLPIWNLVLPSYAYWHMDDFSWGATRVVQGEKKGESHGSVEGEFDSSDIVMKRYVEFERERRWRAGMESRDAPSDAGGMSTMGSYTDEKPQPTLPDDRGALGRLDSVPLLELPAPLGTDSRQRPGPSSPPGAMGAASGSRSPPLSPSGQTNPWASTSGAGAVVPSSPPPLGAQSSNSGASATARQHLFGSMTAGAPRPPTLVRPPGTMSPPRPMAMAPPGPVSPPSFRGKVSSPPPMYTGAGPGSPPVRPLPSGPNPWASVASTAGGSRQPLPGAHGSSAMPSQQTPAVRAPSTLAQAPKDVRRVSLVDDGPVAQADGGMRQVVRGARRQTSVNSGGAASPASPSFNASNPFQRPK